MIAGHGKYPNGYFDPGAKGFISKGEHKYMKENLFPAMKKWVPQGAKAVFFSEYNVLRHGNIEALAKKYGKDTAVVEFHFDGSTEESATGGHVIIHKDYKPDEMDLKLINAIKKNVGVRYTFRGIKGLSGRGSDLGNLTKCRNKGINYRLVELGFGSNKKDSDVMLNKTNDYARDLVEAIFGKVSKPATSTPVKPSGDTYAVKSGDTLWDISRATKVSVDNLKKYNNIKGDLIHPGDVIKLKPPTRTYTVKKGDSLSAIGARLGVKWQDIATKNGIKSPYVIKIGQKLKY